MMRGGKRTWIRSIDAARWIQAILRGLLSAVALCVLSTVWLGAQGLEPDQLLHPRSGTWPLYHGDYSGRRFSPLEQINRRNVSYLTQAWAFQAKGSNFPIKSSPLVVDGILYFTLPDQVWAVDARTGREIWHYEYTHSGGFYIGQRGIGMYRDRLYFMSNDAHLICLDARTGKLRWMTVVADYKLGFFATMAPLIIHNHVIVGASGDFFDLNGFVESFDPDTGKPQWKWNVIPEAGEPGGETWPRNTDARMHGGGMTWMPGTYDPGLNLLYWGIGNPNPTMDGSLREGANLYTCSIVALDPDTGKLAWYFQASPHDVHDWDAVETPVLVDARFHGRERKLLMQASRNGYFFVLDRRTGKDLVSSPFVPINWSKGKTKEGNPIGNPEKEPSPSGTLVEPFASGATNWRSPSFDPVTGLFYVSADESFAMFYHLTTGKPVGYAGKDFGLWSHAYLEALDYETGKSRWRYDLGKGVSGAGVMTTAGGLVFTADTNGNQLALDASTGGVLWHSYGGSNVDNSPITYSLDGRQYVVMAAGDVLQAWTLPAPLLSHSAPTQVGH